MSLTEIDPLDEITIDELPEDQREIAEAVGMEGYRNLVRLIGGTPMRILKKGTLIKARRDAKIRKLYREGYSIPKLAATFDLSDRTIQNVVYGRGKK